MTPADRLIVALDVPASEAGAIAARLMREVGLRRFKVNAATLIEWSGRVLIENLTRDGAELMLDLKVYDIPSTVRRIVEEAHRMGTRWLTVHVDSVMAAVGASGPSLRPALLRPAILAVGGLTTASDAAPDPALDGYAGHYADGVVCHPRLAMRYRKPGKLVVCPGVRPAGHGHDDHDHPMTPREAVDNGADMIVVGRPITAAPDPVAAARAILEELS